MISFDFSKFFEAIAPKNVAEKATSYSIAGVPLITYGFLGITVALLSTVHLLDNGVSSETSSFPEEQNSDADSLPKPESSNSIIDSSNPESSPDSSESIPLEENTEEGNAEETNVQTSDNSPNEEIQPFSMTEENIETTNTDQTDNANETDEMKGGKRKKKKNKKTKKKRSKKNQKHSRKSRKKGISNK